MNEKIILTTCSSTWVLCNRGRSFRPQSSERERAAAFMFVPTVAARLGSHFTSGFSWNARVATSPTVGSATAALAEEAAYCSVALQAFGRAALSTGSGRVRVLRGFSCGLLKSGCTGPGKRVEVGLRRHSGETRAVLLFDQTGCRRMDNAVGHSGTTGIRAPS